MERLILKERAFLPPKERELDEAVAQAELGVRSLIAHLIDGDATVVPEQLLQKARERSAADLKRRSGVDPAYYSRLERLLEYFDFQELRDLIVGGSAWPRFEVAFGSKPTLQLRWDQLANAIRHSRALDRVLVHDGEAALSWVAEVLKRAKPEINHPASPEAELDEPFDETPVAS